MEKNTNASIKCKLQVFNAIIIAQLTYAFDSVHLTLSQIKKIDAFHAKGLRHILKKDHAFYSIISNTKIFEKASIAFNEGQNLEITWGKLTKQ